MKHYRIGVPAEDAALLLSGFSAPLSHAGETCRWLGQSARMRLPAPARTPNVVKLTLASTCRQELSLTVNGDELGRAVLEAGAPWREVALTIPAGMPECPVLDLRSATPHPLDAFVPRCAMLRAISLLRTVELPTPACAAAGAETYNHYFGDIHVHTALSPCGRPNGGTISSNSRFARDERRSDFIAFADHDSRMTQAQWRETMAQLDEFEKPGEFATLFAYEWTSFMFGQMNVYSPSPDLPLFSCADSASDTPARLWRALREWGGPVFTAYHHPTRPGMPTVWDFWDAKLMPVAEIYSGWGNSEYCGAPRQKPGRCVPGTTIQDALGRGCTLGFVGGGDIHNGMPATRGITGVLARELSRKAVFEAIKARRCYATTSEKIRLEFSVNGHLMGSVVPFTAYTADLMYPLKIKYRVAGTMPLGSIEVVTNGGVLVHKRGIEEMKCAAEYSGEFEVINLARGAPAGATLAANSRYFYLRATQPKSREGTQSELHEMVQAELAWSSPVFFVADYSEILKG